MQTFGSVAVSSYEHLSSAERERIAILRASGHSRSAIAKELGRSPSTIDRELRRNALPSGGYSPRQADGAYLERRQRDAMLERDERLRQFVTDRLAEGWSSEQIAGWLKGGNEAKLRSLATETTYAFIYRTSQKAAELWRYLLRRRKIRRPMKARPSRDTIKGRRSIHDRPAGIEDRGEAGHWEADLVICKRARPVLVLHERKTRVTLATRLTGKTAAEAIAAMTAVFQRITPGLRSSVTFNNDTAFARHGLLTDIFGIST
nr:IS30 family transposase [Jiella sonneratiae]